MSAESDPGNEQASGATARPEGTPERKRLVTPRRALIGGIPVMMTLASKSALAWPDCTISRVMSGNMSLAHQIAPTESCAVSPGCWSALKNWNALKGLFSPTSSFCSIFHLPGGKWSCTYQNTSSSSVTLLDALQGKCHVKYTPTNKSPITITYTVGGYGFAAHCAAAILNAAAFSPSGHYLINGVNRDINWVLSQVLTVWATTPSPQTLSGCNSTVGHLCNSFNSSIQGAECTSSL